MRYVRQGDSVCIQWRDCKPVTFVTTMHRATDEGAQCRRRVRNPDTGHHQQVNVQRPQAIADYNSFMGGVDVSDQMIGYYNCLRPTRRYWKTLFFHFIDIAAINARILRSKYREAHPAAIPRSRSYGHSDFVDALIRQLAGIPLNAEVPVTTLGRRSADSALAQRFNHQPAVGENLHNCKVCYQLTGQQKRTRVFCPDCKQNGKTTPLCFVVGRQVRNCFARWHSAEFDDFRG